MVKGTSDDDTVQRVDFASLGIPRLTPSLEEEIAAEAAAGPRHMATADGMPVIVHNHTIIVREQIARDRPSGTPFLTSINGRAEAIVRIDTLSEAERAEIFAALRQGRALIVPSVALLPTASLFCLRLEIHDQPADPYVVEAPRDLCDGNVQDFIAALERNGSAELHLFCGVDTAHSTNGTLALHCRQPPFVPTTFPCQATPNDFAILRQLLERAAEHFRRIPSAARDFKTAAEAYFRGTSL